MTYDILSNYKQTMVHPSSMIMPAEDKREAKMMDGVISDSPRCHSYDILSNYKRTMLKSASTKTTATARRQNRNSRYHNEKKKKLYDDFKKKVYGGDDEDTTKNDADNEMSVRLLLLMKTNMLIDEGVTTTTIRTNMTTLDDTTIDDDTDDIITIGSYMESTEESANNVITGNTSQKNSSSVMKMKNFIEGQNNSVDKRRPSSAGVDTTLIGATLLPFSSATLPPRQNWYKNDHTTTPTALVHNTHGEDDTTTASRLSLSSTLSHHNFSSSAVQMAMKFGGRIGRKKKDVVVVTKKQDEQKSKHERSGSDIYNFVMNMSPNGCVEGTEVVDRMISSIPTEITATSSSVSSSSSSSSSSSLSLSLSISSTHIRNAIDRTTTKNGTSDDGVKKNSTREIFDGDGGLVASRLSSRSGRRQNNRSSSCTKNSNGNNAVDDIYEIEVVTTTTTKNIRKHYNFSRGHPNNDLLPIKEMQEVLRIIASPTPKTKKSLQASLQYLQSDRGDPILLNEISSFLKRRTIDDAVPNVDVVDYDGDDDETKHNSKLDMFLTHGVSHGLDLLCKAQTNPNDIVMVERPTYFLAAGIFTSNNLRVQYLPMKKQEHTISSSSSGSPSCTLTVDVKALAKGLDDGSIPIPRMIYIVPTHQNPTGNTMQLSDRWMLVKLARRYGFIIAADEVYHLLDWSSSLSTSKRKRGKNQRPARFAVLDHVLSNDECLDATLTMSKKASDKNQQQQLSTQGCAVSINSFTKIFSPGLRCGWIEGPVSIIDSIVNLGYIQSQGGCVPFTGNILRTALTSGIQDRYLDKLIMSYRTRSQMLCDTLETENGIRIHKKPEGGYFCWVEFTNIESVEDFANYCQDGGLTIMSGLICDAMLDDDEGNYNTVEQQSHQSRELCKHSARLCFAYMDKADIVDAAKLLIKLYREYIGGLLFEKNKSHVKRSFLKQRKK